ncbi:hypothetical protein L1987_01899 [Smallanthus sonchifolius]|uniref:Uncharacterized protein n=1 Tax=Smallanthus sonchifolius TaxID=185202 RepID=A0ACB9K6D6_9ASTR|nr:hypothetical protein L1987_01899 [Smallanthus sonchifolius]
MDVQQEINRPDSLPSFSAFQDIPLLIPQEAYWLQTSSGHPKPNGRGKALPMEHGNLVVSLDGGGGQGGGAVMVVAKAKGLCVTPGKFQPTQETHHFPQPCHTRKSQNKSQNRNQRRSRKRNQWETRKEQTPTPTQERLCRTQSPTPSPPWLPSPAPLRSDWVNFMGYARRRTALKTVLPPKKLALSTTDIKTLPKRQCLLNQLEIGKSSHQVRPQEVGPTEPPIPPSTERSEPLHDPEAQLSESTNEDSDAVMEALDDLLVQLQGVVDLANSALGRLHGRVAVGETRLIAVEHEVIATEQRNERAGEHLNSSAALTIMNTMLLAFFLFRGWFSSIHYATYYGRAMPT